MTAAAISVTIFGRLYQSTPGVPIAVPSFDAPTLEANGWTTFVGASAPATTSVYTSGAVSGVVTNPSGSPAGLAVRLYIDGSAMPVGVTVADVNGNWSVPTGGLAAGPHMYSVEIDESAGSFVVGSSSRRRQHGFQQFGEQWVDCRNRSLTRISEMAVTDTQRYAWFRRYNQHAAKRAGDDGEQRFGRAGDGSDGGAE